MSDLKRNRNRPNKDARDPRRPIILAKKDDRDEKSAPKILLKPKEKEREKKAPPPQISIAARPIEATQNNAETSNTKVQSTKTSILAPKESKEPPKEPVIQPCLPQMKRPMAIISDHYQIQNSVQDFLIETNVDFFVVGIVGTQGSGKSTILNFLVDDSLDQYEGDVESINDILNGRNGVFKTRNQSKAFSNLPSTEGIQVYVTKHRTILLDCSPVLSNPYKRDGILSELDDLRMLIFLLSICNLLIVVDDNGFNMHFMRLLQTAENMKIDLFEKDLNDFRFSPNILICKNKCRNRDFLPESKTRVSSLYKGFFNGSNLKLTMAFRGAENAVTWNGDESLNIFHFPMIDENKRNLYEAHPDLDILLAELRQRVFMSPRHSVQSQQSTAFTEKNWFHLALAVWDSHKNNYFLRKYESFKEKEWALRV